MEKYIQDLNNKIDIDINKLEEIKEQVNFSSVVSEIRKNNKSIKTKKIKSKKDTTKPSDREKLLSEIDILKEKNNSLAKDLSPLSKLEINLYAKKTQITNKIASLDKVKNSFDYSLVKLRASIDLDKSKLNGKLIKDLEKENKEYEKEILLLQEQLEELRKENKPFNYLSKTIKNKEVKIKKNKVSINIAEKENKKSIESRLERNKDLFDSKKELSNTKENEINQLIKLIEKIDNEFTVSHRSDKKSSFVIEHLDVWYGSKQALFDINVKFPKNKVISVIGPSGCGKSTFLRTLNRINDGIPSFKAKGTILLEGEYDIFKLKSVDNMYDKMELPTLRTKVGMIFQQPNPFPMSIAKNVQYGPKVKGFKNKAYLNELTEQSLKDAGIWEEVKDNLKALGTSLSGGQQQRLCIARAIANEPEILLMDEPTSALDPIAAKKIEDLILKLKKHYTIIMVTHSMQQAQRISDYTAFFYQGNLIEYGTTKQVFESPKEKETKDYISGKFG